MRLEYQAISNKEIDEAENELSLDPNNSEPLIGIKRYMKSFNDDNVSIHVQVTAILTY